MSSVRSVTRRDVLQAGGAAIAAGSIGVISAGTAAAEHAEYTPDHVTLEYDDATVAKYQPQLVLNGVEPRPLGYWGMHATSTESTLNAVYGFVRYPYQEGRAGRNDSHLGDHEPIIVWYDQSSGETVRVDYSAYHWFRGSRDADALAFVSEDRHRPILRVDPRYHHYYGYTGDLPGEQLEREDLTAAIGGWLNNGLEESLALSQPYDPWQMLSRDSWWRHTRSNWLNAWLQAVWFNVGLSDATATADVEKVSVW